MSHSSSCLPSHKVSAILFQIIVVATLFPFHAHGGPLPGLLSRSLSLDNIDPSSDAWADTIAGIGPLILLVGEQPTKQLLCTVRGVTNAFSLAAAPLGLLTVVTSLLRLCGPQRLRAFIGHDLEARTAAAVEMTRVNCGGVHAKLVDGYLVRNTNSHPAGTAVAVSKLDGEFDLLKTEAIRQVKECEVYTERKSSRGVPDDIAPVKWCMQVTTMEATAKGIMEITSTLAAVVGIQTKDTKFKRFQSRFASYYRNASNKPEKTISQTKEMTIDSSTSSELCSPLSAEIPELPLTGSQILSPIPRSTKLTYLLTFGAVSEFATAAPASGVLVFLQGFLATVSITIIHFLALWQLRWIPSVGWILAFFGYVGISLGVVAGSLIISSSCENITLNTRSSSCVDWVDGIIFSVMNPDSMDTSGSVLWSTLTRRPQSFEAVWRKELTTRRTRLSAIISILLTVSYLCRYLGLRSSRWWVSTGELVVCIIAAFARSMSKDTQDKFGILEGVKVDKRCLSTGIIDVQTPERISSSHRTLSSVDIRAYSHQSAGSNPMDGERIAWYIARQYFKDDKFRDWIFELTGLFVEIITDGHAPDKRAALVSFTGGILVEEGLAYPDARLAIAFSCCVSDLAAPTSLMVRGIMRQPKWMVEHEGLKTGTIPLGNVYIFSVNSMINWWTMSEDRNDMGDFQKQLNWPMLFVNIAFFMSILMGHGDPNLVDIISDIHAVGGLERERAEGIVKYIKEEVLS